MSKTLRTVAVIAGAVALVTTGVGAAAGVGVFGATAAASASITGTAVGLGSSIAAAATTVATVASAVGFAASIGAQVTAKKAPARGSVNEVIISADPPAPYLIGRTYSGGVLRHDVGYGATLKKVPNPYRGQVLVHSVAGPVAALLAIYADYAEVPFNGAAASGYYNGFLYRDVRLGDNPDTALTPFFAGMPGWTSAHQLSSKAAILLNGKFDKDGKRFASGWPAMGAVWQGVKTYDARQDSTYPGGSGSHRINDENTWSYSEDPGQHALAYALGRFRNGKKVFGIGLPVDGIVIEHFVELSNVCQANGWKVGGIIYEPGDRWANLKRILEAGGAEPLFIGGKLGLRINAPRVSIYDLNAGDLAEDDAEIPAAKTWRERRNGIRPKFRSEDNKWTYVPSDLVSVPAYIAEDGEEKFEELQWDLVQQKDQVAQLAAYRLVNGREIGPVTLVCKPHMRRFGPGDMITLNLGADHALGGLDAVILKRSLDPSTMKVTLTLETETPGKHDFALGRTGTAPPTPALAATEDKDVIARSVLDTDEISWSGVIDDDPLHPRPEDGATVGATPAERDKLTQLETATAAAQAAIAQAQQDIAEISGAVEGDFGPLMQAVNDLENEVDAVQGDISSLQSSVNASLSALNSDVAALETQATSIAASVSGLNTQVGSINTNVSALTTRIADAEGDIDSLQSTVTSQGAAITANATAITNAQGSLAEYSLRLSSNSRNLLPNGGPEALLRGWTSGTNTWSVNSNNSDGAYFLCMPTSVSTFVLTSDSIPMEAGVPLMLGYETRNTGASAYCDICCFDSTGAQLLDGGQNAGPAGTIWGDRAARAYTITTPANTASVRVRLVCVATSTSDRARVRRIKLEKGTAWSAYANDASVAQSFTAISSAEANVASLQTTVATQGASITSNATAITALTGRTATLETTVSSQGASITSLQTASSTNAGNIASLATRVNVSQTNILANGGLENGFSGAIAAAAFTWSNSPEWGPIAQTTTSGTQAFVFAEITAVQVGATYWISCDPLALGASSIYCDLLFLDASGNTLLDGPQSQQTGPFNFSSDNTRRGLIAASAVAPSGTTKIRARVVAGVVGGQAVGFRRVKVETGPTWTGFSSEASLNSNWSATNTATASIASLTTTVSTQGASITSAQTAITTLQGSVSSLQTTVSTQGASITSLQSTTSTQTGQIAQHTTDIATANSNISANAQAITTANGNIASLTTRVSSAESSISSQATAITGLTGRTATLETTVSTQGASITSLQTTASTTSANLATLTTRVNASQTNLLPNGGLENGFAGAISTASFALSNSAEWGPIASTTTNGTQVFQFAEISAVQVGATYWISCDPLAFGSSSVYCDLLFLDASGNVLLDGPQNSQAGQFNFSSDDTRRSLIAVSAVAPANTARIRARVVGTVVNGAVAGFRRVKVETGPRWTGYSSEASIVQSFTAYSGLNTSLATLSTTVSTQGGSITSLQSSYTSLNGTVSTLSSTVSAQGTSITNLQTASSTQAGQIASLTTTVSTQGTSISSQATAISTLQSQQSTLSSTVSAQGASITSLQTATATLQGNVATLTTRVSASGANILPNGGLENGFNSGISSTGGFQFSASNDWGPIALSYDNGLHVFTFAPVYNPQAGGAYTFSIDPLQFGTSDVYCDIICQDANGNVLVDGVEHGVSGQFNFDNTDTRRGQMACTVASVPTGTNRLICRVFGTVRDGQPIGFRRAKLENGTVWSRYSAEATATQQFQTLSTLTTQYASLSTTVATQGVTISTQATAITTIQGNVTTLFGRLYFGVDVGGRLSSMTVNNNGIASSIIFNSDLVRFESPDPGTGALEWKDEAIQMRDGTGKLRIFMGYRA